MFWKCWPDGGGMEHNHVVKHTLEPIQNIHGKSVCQRFKHIKMNSHLIFAHFHHQICLCVKNTFKFQLSVWQLWSMTSKYAVCKNSVNKHCGRKRGKMSKWNENNFKVEMKQVYAMDSLWVRGGFYAIQFMSYRPKFKADVIAPPFDRFLLIFLLFFPA